MWAAVKAFLGKSWLPYAAAGAIGLIVGAFGWGYLEGHDRAATACKADRVEVLEKQAEDAKTAHQSDTKTIWTVVENTEGLKHDIENLPDIDFCAADDDRLLHFNAPINAILDYTR